MTFVTKMCVRDLPYLEGFQTTPFSDQPSQCCLCRAQQRKVLQGGKELAFNLCVPSVDVPKNNLGRLKGPIL